MEQNRKYLTETELRNILALMYGLISLVDYNVGKLVKTLKECGLYENTLVIFTSDHGDFNSAYGIIGKSWCMDDVLLRVPLIISHPAYRDKTGGTDAPVQNVDILPTMLEYAGLPVLVKTHGESVMPVISGASDRTRDAVFAYDQARCSSQQLYKSMVREGEWKYTRSSDSREELYNLDEDPHEWNNLAGFSKFEPVMYSLKERLLQWHTDFSGLHYRVEETRFWEDKTKFYEEEKFGRG